MEAQVAHLQSPVLQLPTQVEAVVAVVPVRIRVVQEAREEEAREARSLLEAPQALPTPVVVVERVALPQPAAREDRVW